MPLFSKVMPRKVWSVTTRPQVSGRNIFPHHISSMVTAMTISGRWVRLVLVVLAPRFILTFAVMRNVNLQMEPHL